jgi:acetyl-CoA acyltransferase
MGVMSGKHDLVIAGGVDAMSRVPLGSTRQPGFPYGPRVMGRYDNFSFNQGISAEMIAEKWNRSRGRRDEFAARSHALAAAPLMPGHSMRRSCRWT